MTGPVGGYACFCVGVYGHPPVCPPHQKACEAVTPGGRPSVQVPVAIGGLDHRPCGRVCLLFWVHTSSATDMGTLWCAKLSEAHTLLGFPQSSQCPCALFLHGLAVKCWVRELADSGLDLPFFFSQSFVVCGCCPVTLSSEAAHISCHTPSNTFWHFPPNSARTGYATALRIFEQLSPNSVGVLRKLWVLIRLWKQHSTWARKQTWEMSAMGTKRVPSPFKWFWF